MSAFTAKADTPCRSANFETQRAADLCADARSVREFLHAVRNNLGELHNLLVQFRVFSNSALNATAIGLQLSPQFLKFANEIFNFAR
jgi:hypothetical protein